MALSKMKTRWIEVFIIVMALGLLSLCFAAWDVTKPADSDGIYTWPTSIRANWVALEAVFGVDLADAGLSTYTVNVKDSAYGALGDDSNDDIEEITAAIAALPAEGGVLIFPDGVYKITTPITFGNKPIHMIGLCSTQVNTANASAVQIKNYGDDDAILINPNAIVGRSIIENIDIIDGHGARTDGDGIHAERAGASGNLSVTLRNVRVAGHVNGFYLVRCLLSTLSQCIAVSNDNHGFYYASTATPGSGTSILTVNCFANGNTADGYYVDGHTYCTWLNCASDGNVNGYTVTDIGDDSNPAGHSFIGCGAETNTGVGIVFVNGIGTSNMLISGGLIASSTSDGIQTNDCFNLTIQNVKLVSNGDYGIDCTNTVFGRVTLINNNYSANTTGEVSDSSGLTTRVSDSTSGVVRSSGNVGMLSLLSITTVSLAADADTTIYTVPTGKRCILSHAILVAGADASTSDISIGKNGTETDFIPAYDLQHLDAEYDCVLLAPIPAVISLQLKSYAATSVIEAQVTNQAGGATNTLYLYGTLY